MNPNLLAALITILAFAVLGSVAFIVCVCELLAKLYPRAGKIFTVALALVIVALMFCGIRQAIIDHGQSQPAAEKATP